MSTYELRYTGAARKTYIGVDASEATARLWQEHREDCAAGRFVFEPKTVCTAVTVNCTFTADIVERITADDKKQAVENFLRRVVARGFHLEPFEETQLSVKEVG